VAKKTKQNLLKYILAGFLFAFSIAFLIITLNLQKFQRDDNWKTYQNKEFGFSFKYPSSVSISSKKETAFNLYLNQDNEEVLRIHIYKETKKEESELKIKTKKVGNNSFDVLLIPAGLDSGDFKLTQPILYYILYRDGIKFSFQFNNRITPTSLQKDILSTLEF